MRGRIYRLEFPDGYFYIGSTTGTLEQRKRDHRRHRLWGLKETIKINYPLTSRFMIYLYKYGWTDPSITLIEELEVQDRRELEKKEFHEIQRVFDDAKNLNDVCPGRHRRKIKIKITDIV
jgi:hypothetical protein